jgi:hypothetical protein
VRDGILGDRTRPLSQPINARGALRPHLQGLLRAAVDCGLVAIALLIPFENALGRIWIGGRRLTDLELVAVATTVVWVGLLVSERRRPMVPGAVLAAVGALLVTWAASTIAAGSAAQTAPWTVLRFAIALLPVLVTADRVRSGRAASQLLLWMLAALTVSAVLGVGAWLLGSGAGLPGAGRLFEVAGIDRTAGTFVHPNVAAVAWEAILIAGLGLLAGVRSTRGRLLLGAALAVIGVGLVLTVSRGGLLGLVAGLAVLAGVAVAIRRRAIAVTAAALGGMVVIGSVALQLGGGLPVSRLVSEGDRGLYGATYQAPAEIQLPPLGEMDVPIALVNTGSSIWTGGGDFVLSYHWIDPQGVEIRSRPSLATPLAEDVAPGEQAVVQAEVRAPAEQGEHRLVWDLRQSDDTWFSEKTVPTALSQVRVLPGAQPAAEGVAPSYELYPELLPVPTRFELWTAGLAMVRAAPVLGIGPGQFRLYYGAYLGWPAWNGGIHSNNLVVELAANTGLLGLVAFLALLAVALVPQAQGLLESVRVADRTTLLRAGMLGAIVAFLAHQMVDYFFGFTSVGVMFWMMLGMGLGVALGSRPAAEVRTADS